ncbi:MAG: hypothetical protein LBT83_09390, partial [Tannerella sp.]|nr:hypothetical protein [Tannerella sp.]
FKAAFTAAEGWGSYMQKQTAGAMECVLEPKYGRVQLSAFSVEIPDGTKIKEVKVSVDGQTVPAVLKQKGTNVTLTFQHRRAINEGEKLSILMKQK